MAGEGGEGAPWLLCWLFSPGGADIGWDPAPRVLLGMLCSVLSRAVELNRADLVRAWERILKVKG